MKFVLILLLFGRYFVVNGSSEIEKLLKTIHGNPDPEVGRTVVIDANFEDFQKQSRIQKRAAENVTNSAIDVKINPLNDTHKQLMVHWVGDNSNVIICLARDPALPLLLDILPVNPSAVYISYNYGDTYENKTDMFKLSNGSYATVEKFYNHPKFSSYFVFTDIRNNRIYSTKNLGKTLEQHELGFTPSEVLFKPESPSIYLVLDKKDPERKLYITENFGETFRTIHEYVKSAHWVEITNGDHQIVVDRMEHNNISTIVYSSNLFKLREVNVIASNVLDLHVKNDYLFYTEKSLTDNNKVELFYSYKNQNTRCVFATTLPIKSYYIVDVQENRALIAVSHTDSLASLYVSYDLNHRSSQGSNVAQFRLSLEDVFCYFPNKTWQDTFLHHVSEDPFADVYKVEGLEGIYIASKVFTKPVSKNLGPQHLISMITFDYGGSWRLIKAPQFDVENQPTGCDSSKNCSLHLSQKFSQLYPDTRTISILSSKAAPGILMATGVLGSTLKGHYGVYMSVDAGLTWRQTFRDLYFFNMGDHGGILTAVKYFKQNGETKHVLYSTNEGKTWKQTPFHNEDIRLYGLMTEPGENTTIFTMFGSLPNFHQWIIIKLDFRKAFKYTCTEDDFKPWSPSQSEEDRNYVPCVMGKTATYKRKIPSSNCYNGNQTMKPMSTERCQCDILDFECDFGFKRAGTAPHRCYTDTSLHYDPYKLPKICPANTFYNRTKGYRLIAGDECTAGFKKHYLPDLVPCPIEYVDDFLLFAQREKISRFNLITKTLVELPVKNLKNVIAIDFDLMNNCLYWADIALDIIGRQCFNGQRVEILLSSDLASIEGMALDWISKTLYFVDGVRSKIELIRTDIKKRGRMRTTVLDSKVLKKPRGITLHPQAGYMFWTDWSADSPSVSRANLDGSNVKVLFGKETVEWPNGICVDYIANRIYWVDAKLDYIASSDLHGDGFVKVIVNEEVVSHPFAIAVFKNQMYWDDWKRNAIFSADKETFTGVEVLYKQLMGLMDLKVFAHGIQFGSNACTNNDDCPYTCVGLPKDKYACLCPDGLEMVNGKCMCPENVAPSASLACPKVNNTCSAQHFTCRNSKCVPKGWKCDGENDCGDDSDEEQCGTCPPNFFVCGDGKCLPHYWRCDYDVDCPDRSDEMNCPRQNCTENQFTCNNGRCISEKWKCDRENDCRDGSDEQNCEDVSPTKCQDDEFQCKSGEVHCIPSTWRCDQEPDCRDSSDEHDCTNNTCSERFFSCGPPINRCINNSWVCDGDKDCEDGRDEKNCTSSNGEPSTPVSPFLPVNNGTCQDWMFKCQNNQCVPVWWKCDGTDDCGDGSDEMACPNRTLPHVPPTTSETVPIVPLHGCKNNQFECSPGRCIYASWVCDGQKDCLNGEDEMHCEDMPICGANQFKCREDGSCIPISAVCNEIPDCPDHTDELFCNHQNLPPGPATPSCSVGYFPCDGGSCYPMSLICDSKRDCKNGWDELNCTNTSRIYQIMSMGVDNEDVSENSIKIHWESPSPANLKYDYIPSISKVGENKWQNKSVVDDYTEYVFENLEAYTTYNMTVFVKNNVTQMVHPPAKYIVSRTQEGVPTAPWNITASQLNGSHILISWKAPINPKGIIVNYMVCWNEKGKNNNNVRTKIGRNDTKYSLSFAFEHDKSYNFFVVAYNSKHNSEPSNQVTIHYDGLTVVTGITDLKIQNNTNHSVSLSWNYDGTPDGFSVKVTGPKYYPKLPPLKTKTKNITISLAPGATYRFDVWAFQKTFLGPSSSVSGKTEGDPLPSIGKLEGILINTVGTSVKLSWDRPKDSRKVQWIYGVYYGIMEEDMFAKARHRTTNLSAVIENLNSCEFYMFSVGIVGPIGYGILNGQILKINTTSNPLSPPKNVTVTPGGDKSLELTIRWDPPCVTQKNKYLVEIHEVTTRTTWTKESTELNHKININYGGKYQIRVRTLNQVSTFSKPVYHVGPQLDAPYEIKVVPESNGSYIVFWEQRPLPDVIGNFNYEVLVSEGNTLDERSANKFIVKAPPFIYTNSSGTMYTFAVRIKTEQGLNSVTSEYISKYNDVVVSSVNVGMIVGFVVFLVASCSLIGFLVMRNRNLRSSFSRFANSHYDTRSQAATFDDTGLDDDDCPQIRDRFADDEPLVVA